MEGKTIYEVLTKYGIELEKRLTNSLKAKGHTGAGGSASRLAGSMRFEAKILGNNYEFSFFMNDYYKYIDGGRGETKKKENGKVRENIKNWIKWKGIKVPSTSELRKKKASQLKNKTVRKAYKEQSFEKRLNSLAYMIAQAIHKKGTIKRFGYKGSQFYTNHKKKWQEDLKAELSQAMAKDIKINFE